MFSVIKKRLVRSLKYRLSNRYPDPPDYLGDKFHCPVCDTNLAHFLPLPMFYFKELEENQYIHSPFQSETLNLLNYLCPACYASDRDRLFVLYLNDYFKSVSSKINLVEFAPSKSLTEFIKKNPQVVVRTADLFMENVDDKVDLTNLDIYQKEIFDFFICSHILEHIPEDKKALKELYRILKPGGKGIVMVPINLALTETYENASAITDGDRWKHFGQNDHVRLYSKKGFIEKLEDSRFLVEQLGIEYFGKESFEKHGIHPRSVLYIVSK